MVSNIACSMPEIAPVRVVQVRLDEVYSADPAQQERNLSMLLDRIQVLGISYRACCRR